MKYSDGNKVWSFGLIVASLVLLCRDNWELSIWLMLASIYFALRTIINTIEEDQ